MRKSTAGAAAAVFGAAAAVTALTVGVSTGAAASAESEAFGLSADGLVKIAKIPHVTSADGTLQEKSLLKVPLSDLGEIRVATQTSGDNVASSELAGVELGAAAGKLSVEVLEVECEGTKGTVEILDLRIGGQEIVIPPAEQNPVNQKLEVPGVAKITYNKQTTNPDGSFTVVGLEVDLLNSTQVVTLGSATCADADGGSDDGGTDDGGADDGTDGGNDGGDGGADDGTDGGADDGGADDAGDGGADDGTDDGGDPSATKPAPITTGLPVTG